MSAFSKRITAITAILLAMAVVAPAIMAAPAALVDVPKDHWAYDAVSLMVSKGYMGVYDSGKFMGDDSVSRYLLAFVTAKLLMDVEAGRTALSDDDMRVVRELSTTLREQLAVVVGRMNELEKATASASSGVAIAQDNAARAAVQYAELNRKIEEQRRQLQEEIKNSAEAGDQKLTVLFSDVKKQSSDTRAELDRTVTELTERLDASVATSQAEHAATTRDVGELKLRLNDIAATVAANKAWAESAIAGEAGARVDALAAVNARIAQLASGLDAAGATTSSEAAALRVLITDEAAARAQSYETLVARQNKLENEIVVRLDKAIELERSARTADIATLMKHVGELSVKHDSVQAALEAEIGARQQADAALKADADALAAAIAAEREAREKAIEQVRSAEQTARSGAMAEEAQLRKEQAAVILKELETARAGIVDLDRKTAQADAAIIASIEAESTKLAATISELAALTETVNALSAKASGIGTQLDELGKKQATDYAQQRQALVDLKVSLDQLSKQLGDKIAANSSEIARVAGRGLENTMAINDIVDALNETRTVLSDTIAALDEANADIASVNRTLDDINKRLVSMENVMQGSVDELRKRFADDLVAERWEAEAREIKLQQMIEDLQRRVDVLEAQHAPDQEGNKSGSGLLVLGGLAALAAIIALVAGGSK